MPEPLTWTTTSLGERVTGEGADAFAQGTLTEPGERHLYTFEGSENQRIWFDSLSSSVNINTRLVSPTGEVVWSYQPTNQDSDQGTPQALPVLAEAGTYQLLVDGSNDAIGDYRFRLINTDQAPVVTESGSTIALNGSFGPDNETRTYQFTGTAGQELYFDHHSGSYRYSLYGPDGQAMLNGLSGYDRDENVQLLADGQYTLVVRGNANNSYDFEIVSPDPVPTQALTLSTPVSGTVSEPGEAHSFEFTGDAGQQLWFDNLLANSDLRARLYTPSGIAVTSYPESLSSTAADPFQNSQLQLVLPEGGTYRLEIEGYQDGIGDYQFQLLEANGQDAPLQTWDATTDTIQFESSSITPETVDLYRFTGVEGETLFVDHHSGSFTYNIYDAAGVRQFNGSGSDRFHEPFNHTGEYTLAISSSSGYDFTFFTPEVSATTYTLGETIEARLDQPREVDEYTFHAKPGQHVWFDGLAADSTNIQYTLITPGGKELFYTNPTNSDAPILRDGDGQQLHTLSELGTYTLRVETYGSSDVVGDYSLRILDADNAPELAPNEVNGETTASGNFTAGTQATQIYRLEGLAGQNLYIENKLHEFNSETDYSIKVIGPDGKPVEFDYTPQTDKRIEGLPQDGDYWLVVQSEGVDANYELQVHLSTPEPTDLALNTAVSGTIAQLGEQDVYLFEGAAGQKLFFDNQGSDADIEVTLYPPGNAPEQRVIIPNSTTGAEDSALTLGLSGTYRIVVEGDQNRSDYAGATYQFQLSDRAAVPTLTLDSPYSTQTLDPQTTQLYRLDSIQGQLIDFDIDALTDAGVEWVLYDNGDRPIIGGGTTPVSDDFRAVIPADGQYTLAVINDGDTALNYGFTANAVSETAVENDVNRSVTNAALTSSPATYTLTANAGTQVVFHQQDWRTATLIAPDGSTEVFATNRDFPVTAVLPQTGDYTLQIEGSAGTAYSFDLLELTPFATGDGAVGPTTPENNSIRPNTLIADVLESYGTQVYTLQGQPGQRLLLDGLNETHVSAKLYKPNGEELTLTDDIATLPNDGSYQLVILTDQPGTRSFDFQLIDLDTAPALQPGTPVSGTHQPYNGKTVYRLAAEAGQMLFLDSLGSQTGYGTLYGPDGQTVYRYGSETQTVDNWHLGNDLRTAVLTQSGDYTFVIESGSNSTYTPNYNFQFLVHEPAATVDLLVPGDGEQNNNATDDASYIPVTIEADDGREGRALQDYVIRLLPDPDNNAPVIISDAPTEVGLNQTYRYDLSSIDPDEDALRYRLIEAPTGAFINSDTGELIWLPSEADANFNGQALIEDFGQFTVEVSDGRGGVDQQSFDIDLYQTLGTVQGAVFEDYNQDRVRGKRFIEGDNPTAVYVIDISGSTMGRQVDWTTVDPNDAFTPANLILDQEIAAAITLNQQILQQGSGETSTIGLVVFDHGGAIVDLDPTSPENFTTAGADLNDDGVLDFIEQLNTLQASGGTDFNAGLIAATNLFSQIEAATLGNDQELNLIFLSDGYSQVNTELVTPLLDKGVNIQAIGIGEGASMEQLRMIDPDAVQASTAEELLQLFSGLGAQQDSEPWMEDIQVYLDLNDNGILDADEPWQYTTYSSDDDAAPYYQFSNLMPGQDYTVRVVLPEGYTMTVPTAENDHAHVVTVDSNGQTSYSYFGLYKAAEIPNRAPAFTSTPDNHTVTVAENWEHTVAASDPDSDRLTYSLSVQPEGMVIDPDTGKLQWQPDADQVGSHYVIVKTADGNGGVDLQAFAIEVEAPNQAPIFTSSFPTDARPRQHRAFTYTLNAVDPDTDDTLTYELVSGADASSYSLSDNIFTWTPPTTGEQTLTFKVSDGRGGEDLQTVTIDVGEASSGAVNTINNAPKINGEPRKSIRYDTLYTYDPDATDADGDLLTYSLTVDGLTDLPAGLVFDDTTGQIGWLPTAGQLGSHDFVLTVSDGYGGASIQSWSTPQKRLF